ncbi:MAG: hypothetical protein IT315_11055 [Anaerolineales bacterium]|nr:hypothetical protein [Anaerolineales bacterium]
MKIKKASQWFNMLIFVTVVTGCAQSTESTITSSTTTPILMVSASPTATMPPTLTPTATDAPTLTFTPTTVSTLPAEDARKRLLELLATNGDCRLPCLWGITPGKSDNQEARTILIPLSSVAEFPPYFDPSKVNGNLLGVISPLYVEGEQHLDSRVVYLYDDNGIVSSIGFEVIEEKVEKDPRDPSGQSWLSKMPILDSATFGKRVEYYSLSHVLSEQGIPDSVLIYIPRVEGQPIVAGIMEAVLIYSEQGIWVKYTMPMYSKGDIEAGCPANAHIEMTLSPSGSPDNFYKLLDQTDWRQTKGGFKSIEEATSMSIEEFYQMFREPTDQCIETPLNLWSTQ